jgi:hypothetical protein
MVYSFEKLEVWEKSRDLVKGIYQITPKAISTKYWEILESIR